MDVPVRRIVALGAGAVSLVVAGASLAQASPPDVAVPNGTAAYAPYASVDLGSASAVVLSQTSPAAYGQYLSVGGAAPIALDSGVPAQALVGDGLVGVANNGDDVRTDVTDLSQATYAPSASESLVGSSGDGWILTDSADGSVVHQPVSGTRQTFASLSGSAPFQIVADDTGVAWLDTDQVLQHNVLVAGTYAAGTASTIMDFGPSAVPDSLLLTGSDVVGWSFDGTITRVPRAGGTVTTRQASVTPCSVAANDAYAAVVDCTASSTVTLVPANAVANEVTVQLPAPVTSVVAQGNSFTALVSDGLTASAYTFTDDTDVTKLYDLSNPPAVHPSLNLSAGVLTYNDDTDTAWPVWQRSVSDAPLSVTDPATMLLARSTGEAQSVVISGARGLVSYEKSARKSVSTIVDQGAILQSLTLPRATAYSVSGPWFKAGKHVLTASGQPVMNYVGPGPSAQFGSSFVYQGHKGAVMLSDLTDPGAKPRELLGACLPKCNAVQSMSLWGTTLVVQRTYTGGRLTVVNIGNGKTHTVKVGSVSTFAVGSNALVMNTNAVAPKVKVLDLSRPKAKPVTMGTTWYSGPVSIDDHLIAYEDAGLTLHVAELPFGQGVPIAPRFLGALAAKVFSPNGDGKADTWQPQFDATKSLTSYRLTIRRNGNVVKVLQGTAPLGAVRAVSWNGRTTTGSRARAGLSSWRLTGVAADGSGELCRADGSTKPITGTVTLIR